MTMTISEALNRAEALSAGLDWILLSQYEVRSEYTSTEVSIDLDNRVIGDLSENVSTEGENNAEYISFIMDRYHDGIDLSNMLIQVQYELEDGSGSIDGVVNAYMNDDQIKFGWVVPPAAAQIDAVIKIMVFCTGTLGANTYTLKTLPMEYTIHSTLETGGSIPQPDENWYLQFANTMQQNVLVAKASADAAAQSASDANDDLADIKDIQNDVNTSKSTVQTLAAQVQSDTTKAQASATAAKVSEETAKSWAERAQELSGVNYASKQLAGIVAPQDVYVNPENGYMSIITQTTDGTLSNSYQGGIKINKVHGKSEQRTTTGAQLFGFPNGYNSTASGVTGKDNGDGTLSIIGTATQANGLFLLGSGFIGTNVAFSLSAGTYYVSGLPTQLSLYLYKVGDTPQAVKVYEKGSFTLDVDTDFVSVSLRWTARATFNSPVTKIMLNAGAAPLPWEPYTGGIPSPNLDYPQEIKSVEVSEITSSDDNGNESTVIFSTPITLRGIGDIKDRIVRKDGLWKIERKFVEDVFDGSDDELLSYDSASSRLIVRKIQSLAKPAITDNSVANILCDSLLVCSVSEIYSPINTNDRIALSPNAIVSLRSLKITSLAEWKTQLAEKPIKVIYEANEPAFEPLPIADQIALNSLVSFDGVTYLSFDSEIEPTSLVEYGTSRVGALALETWNTAQRNEIEITAMKMKAAQATTEEEVTA